MSYIYRKISADLEGVLSAGKSVLLLGPRQTGKSTLMSHVRHDLLLNLVQFGARQRYEQEPDVLRSEIERLSREKKAKDVPLVILDEVQKVPSLLDVVQDLIDRNVAQFVLLGSSARKLRRGTSINLLPGRIISYRLDPLSQEEWQGSTLEELLQYGSLPGIVQMEDDLLREQLLRTYVETYLEEEVRAEALVRKLSDFGRFLSLAAAESGQLSNFRALSQDIGVAVTTIQSYYQILEDCLIVDRIEPLTKSRTRRTLTKSSKYLFFDLGVRRVAAREGIDPPRDRWGTLLEQYVGLELLRASRQTQERTSLHFWRDPHGPEVDWVLRRGSELIPIEVKWTDRPHGSDALHLRTFLREYPEAKRGFIVCRTPRAYDIADNITAIPVQELGRVFIEE